MKPQTSTFPITVDLPLRAHRKYLHSTNLFDCLVARTGATRNLSLMFRRKIEHQAEAIVMENDDPRYPATFTGEGEGGLVRLALIEKEPQSLIERREPYDEDVVADGSTIAGKEITSATSNGASAIERIVSLNKRLLTQVTAGQKVLVFSRIDLKLLPDANEHLRISLKSQLGLKLFRSAIFACDAEIGEVLFYGT